jgi:hypothetical protein
MVNDILLLVAGDDIVSFPSVFFRWAISPLAEGMASPE